MKMRDALGTRIWFRDPLHQVKFSDYNQRMRSHCLITEPSWAAHDLNHTIQAERALMQPFMLGCGPWRSFFRDHEVGVPE